MELRLKAGVRAAPTAAKIKMDDYMFRFYVDECRAVEETTSYMEIFNYSVRLFLFLPIVLFLPRQLVAVQTQLECGMELES